MKLQFDTISLGDIALCVVAACVVWALIHGWG
jgi:hypothetical protein